MPRAWELRSLVNLNHDVSTQVQADCQEHMKRFNLSVSLYHLLFYVATAQHSLVLPVRYSLVRITYNRVLSFNSSIFGNGAFPFTSIPRGAQCLARRSVCTRGRWHVSVCVRVCSQTCFTAAAELEQKMSMVQSVPADFISC